MSNCWMRSLGVLLLMLVTVTAQGDGNCTDGDFELIQDEAVDGIVGYVRYCRDGQWRSVCTEKSFNWNENEAEVACRQLGYQGEGDGVGCPSGAESGSIINNTFVVFLCNASLNGTESSLQDCAPNYVNSCVCGKTARVRCDPADCTDNEIRLVGGSTDREGRVEVCVDGRWGTVQTNNPGELAQTVCEPLTESLEFYSTASCYVSQFGYSLSKPVYSCSLTDSNELTCHNHISDSHERDLAVVCRNSDTQIRCARLVDDDLTCVEPGLAVNFTSYQELLANDTLCGVHQQGHYRVQNGAVLQECVDQQWTTVDNTSQLLTVVQEDIDQLINKSLTTQCPTTPPEQIPGSTSNDGSSLIYIAVMVVLAVSLLATAAGWIITCVVVARKKYHFSSYKPSTPLGAIDVTETNNYSLAQNYEETTPTSHAHRPSTSRKYDTVLLNEQVTYDRLQHSSRSTGNQPALTTTISEELTGDKNTEEQHVYSALNETTLTDNNDVIVVAAENEAKPEEVAYANI